MASGCVLLLGGVCAILNTAWWLSMTWPLPLPFWASQGDVRVAVQRDDPHLLYNYRHVEPHHVHPKVLETSNISWLTSFSASNTRSPTARLKTRISRTLGDQVPFCVPHLPPYCRGRTSRRTEVGSRRPSFPIPTFQNYNLSAQEPVRTRPPREGVGCLLFGFALMWHTARGPTLVTQPSESYPGHF